LLTFERAFIIIFLLALLLRFVFLDLKLFHHDEAIHAWFSFRLLSEGIYQYSPVYHGPLLYYVTAGVFALLGDSDLTARLVPALLGTLLIPLTYVIHRLGYLTKPQTLLAALFIAISPDMVYFSRFLRNDIFIIFLTLALLVCLLLYIERGQLRYALLAGLVSGLGIACKENMPIILLIFAVYLLYLIISGRWELPGTWKRDFILAMMLVGGIVTVLYSSFGMHPEMATDWWLRAIEHWTAMHQEQRLGGPPYIYVLLFMLYELPILLLALFATGQFLLKRKRITTPTFPEIVAKSLAQLRSITVRKIDRNHEFTRFCIFWMLASMLVYAYIGEKVPWLILHQLLPMIFVSVYLLSKKKAVIAVAGSVFLIVICMHLVFTPADINEPIVQVQNSEELRETMALIDASDNVAIATTGYWPLPWYYRGDRGSKLSYLTNKWEEPDFFSDGRYDLIITHDTESFDNLTGYQKRTFRASYWFSYYDNKDRLIQYYFMRDGPAGSVNWDIFSKKAV